MCHCNLAPQQRCKHPIPLCHRNQQTNARYVNGGGRIDYTLVDAPFFFAHARRGPVSLDCGLALKAACGGDPSSSSSRDGGDWGGLAANGSAGDSVDVVEAHVVDSFQAALAACTLSGTFKAVPMSGGGLEDAPQWAYDHHFRPPATGIIYTPPQYSDHVAVTLLLGPACLDSVRAAVLGAERQPGGNGIKFDAATKRCQPQAATASITSFFGKKSPAAPAAAPAQKRKAEGAPQLQEKAKPGIRSFFKKR